MFIKTYQWNVPINTIFSFSIFIKFLFCSLTVGELLAKTLSCFGLCPFTCFDVLDTDYGTNMANGGNTQFNVGD